MLQDLWDSLKEADREAKAEALRRNKLLHYDPKPFDNCTHSPREFYAMVLKNLEWRKVPELTVGFVWMKERHLFSKRRLYLQLKRERLVFEMCAAPFGTGYFVSNRLFDRRREANWLSYVICLFLLLGLFASLQREFGWAVAVVVLGTLVTTIWSLMRLAITSAAVALDELICELPLIGPIYESFFHPDTYYRQDTNTMYSLVVKKAFAETVAEFEKMKGIRPDVSSSGFVSELPTARVLAHVIQQLPPS